MIIDWQCSPATWQAVLDQVPQATFFHSPAWAATVEAVGDVRCTAAHIRWPDGRQAIVPLAIRRIWGGMMRLASTSLEGCYGGVLANGPVSDEELSAVYRAIRRRYPDLRIYGNPFQPVPSPATGIRPSEATRVRVFALAPLGAMRQAYRPSRRGHVRRYQAEGVTTTLIPQPDATHLPLFMRLYAHETGFWASRDHIKDEAWFRRLWARAHDHLTLVVARKGDEVAGVALDARQGDVVTQLCLAWDRRFVSQQIPTALMEGSLQESYAQGCRYLDVMSCAQQAGIDHFKASFGAAALPIWCDYRPSAVTTALMAAKSLLKGRSTPTLAHDP
jgi:hypothetical protein